MGQKSGEKKGQHSLVLWHFVRCRKEHLVFLWCSGLLAGDLLKLFEEDPGRYTGIRSQWALTLAPGESSFSLFPDIPIFHPKVDGHS